MLIFKSGAKQFLISYQQKRKFMLTMIKKNLRNKTILAQTLLLVRSHGEASSAVKIEYVIDNRTCYVLAKQ